MAAAVVEDTSVERVGGAFIDEERSLKMPGKRPKKNSGATGKVLGHEYISFGWIRDPD